MKHAALEIEDIYGKIRSDTQLLYKFYLHKAVMEKQTERSLSCYKSLTIFSPHSLPDYRFHLWATAAVETLRQLSFSLLCDHSNDQNREESSPCFHFADLGKEVTNSATKALLCLYLYIYI